MKTLKRECIIWKKRPILWVILGLVVLTGYLGFMGYPVPMVWSYLYDVLSIKTFSSPEAEYAAYNALWKSMLAYSAEPYVMLLVPVVLIGTSFGLDLKKDRLQSRLGQGVSAGSVYRSSFLFLFAMNFLLRLIGWFFEFVRMGGLMSGYVTADDGTFLLQILIGSLIHTLFFVSMAQLFSVIFVRLHVGVSLLLSFVITLFLRVGLEILLLGRGEGKNLASYYMIGTETGGWESPVRIPVESAETVRVMGYCYLGILILCAVAAWIVGQWLFSKKMKQDMAVTGCPAWKHIKPESGKAYVVLTEEKSLVTGTEKERCLYYDKLDLRENLRVIQLSMGKDDRNEIEKLAELIGMAGQNERKKHLKVFTEDMKLCYEMAVGLLCGDAVLVPATITDETDREGCALVRAAIRRIKEQGGSVVLGSPVGEVLYDAADYFLVPNEESETAVWTKQQIEERSVQTILLETDERKRTEQVLNNLVPEEYRYDTEKDQYIITSHTVSMKELLKKLKTIGVVVKKSERDGQNVSEVFGAILKSK